MRQSNTFARSNVMGNDEPALKTGDGAIHHPITTRQEKNWSSNVFAGAKPDAARRKNLARGDAGRGGLYGDEHEDWNKKQNFAGAFKRDTQPKYLVEAAANERKMKELYGEKAQNAGKKGDGSLMTSSADWRNPHQTYTNQYNSTQKGIIDDELPDRKERKVAELSSNILTHEDENLRNERYAAFDRSKKREFQASNASWSA